MCAFNAPTRSTVRRCLPIFFFPSFFFTLSSVSILIASSFSSSLESRINAKIRERGGHVTDSHRLRGQGEKLERGREKSFGDRFTGRRERGDISSGSAGFALIAPLELRFRQASPIVPGPARIAANPSGWLHAHRIHRTRPVQRGDSFIRSGVRSHGMLDRCNPCCSSSFAPFSSARARISTLLCYIYMCLYGEKERRRRERGSRYDTV